MVVLSGASLGITTRCSNQSSPYSSGYSDLQKCRRSVFRQKKVPKFKVVISKAAILLCRKSVNRVVVPALRLAAEPVVAKPNEECITKKNNPDKNDC